MNKYNNLLMQVSEEYRIRRGKTEEQNQWKARLIYSLIGRMALASLFDVDEEDISSVIHMKRRIESLMVNYREMYPELKRYLPLDSSELSNEIYDIYLHTGVIYHKPNHILMATRSEISFERVIFSRGFEMESSQNLSGLGTYRQADSITNIGSLTDMFQMETSSLSDFWDYYVNKAEWREYKVETIVEYLRTVPPFSRGYWVDKPDVGGKISLLRTGFKGSRLYYLYKIEAGIVMASQLPQWMVEDYRYRLFANACLCKQGVLPPTIYKYDGELVYINFKYLPPPAELYLWKLYSWPETMSVLPKDFKRICVRSVFSAIKKEMETKGYCFIEE